MIKTTYKVLVKESDGYWIISVPSIRFLNTQALSRESVEFMTRDAISLMLEVEPSSFDLDFKFLSD